MPTFEDNSIEIMDSDKIKRIFLVHSKWPRRFRRLKSRCSNKKHTSGRISYHKIHSLTIENTTVSSTSGTSTLKFESDATNNLITNRL